MAGSAVKQEPGEASGSGAPWSSATGAPWPAGMKVLVVDDDPLCLKVVSLMLQKCDYKGKQLCHRPAILPSVQSSSGLVDEWSRSPRRNNNHFSDRAVDPAVAPHKDCLHLHF